MQKFIFLILIIFAACASAQTWPSGAFPDPLSGQAPPPPGQTTLRVDAQMLKNNPWSDKRGELQIGLGLNDGLGVYLRTTGRELSRDTVKQHGMGDSKLGLAFWPELSDHLALGINGDVIIPSGYRQNQKFYSSATDTLGQTLPDFSLKQTAGEFFAGAEWTISPLASLHGAAGYFCNSDRSEQAFRWNFGARLNPAGPRVTAEFDFAESLHRIGQLPDVDVFSAALVANVAWGLSLSGGVWADLDYKPLYGANIGLRMTIPMRTMPKTKNDFSANAPLPPPLKGTVLLPPPQSDFPLADQLELWENLQRELSSRFESVQPLPSLDVPGLPYDNSTQERQHQSLRALAVAHPDCEWILITHVEREDIGRRGGISMLLVTRPEWTAQCRMSVELIHLPDGRAQTEKVIEARASQPDKPQFTVLGSPEKYILSYGESHDLALQVYRDAGRRIAREVCRAQ